MARRDRRCGEGRGAFMNTWQEMVEDFHTRMGIPVGRLPSVGSREERDLRLELLLEECGETIDGLSRADLPAIADGLCDLIYVALGTAVQLGINLEPLFAAVHAANMAKTGGPVSTTGKQGKPPGWTPPDIAGLLRAQGWTP